MVTQERTPVSPEDEAADVYAACDRIDASAAKVTPELRAKIDELSALMKTDIEALAAAREAGRLEGLEEAAQHLETVRAPREPYGHAKAAVMLDAAAIRELIEAKR